MLVHRLIDHAALYHRGAEIVSRTVEGSIHRSGYAQIRQRALGLARALAKRGIRPGDRVATLAWNTHRHLECWYGIAGMGAVYHTLNPRLFPDQIAWIANHGGARALFYDNCFAPIVEAIAPQLKHVEFFVAMSDEIAPIKLAKKPLCYETLVAESTKRNFEWPALDEKSACGLCYTSGTTGDPKGVLYSQRSNMLTALMAGQSPGLNMGPMDRVLPVVPMFHANGWGLPYAALMAGADLVLPDCRLDPRSLIDMVERLRPTVAGAVPTIWNDVMHCLEKDPDHDISSLRLVVCGGSAVPVSLMRTFEARYGVQIRQLWGMTETSPLATMAWPPPGTPEDQHWAFRGTQGQPVGGVEMRIVDDGGQVLPSDGEAVGEVEVRGPWIAGSYYLGRDESKFESGWFRTGDVGRIDARGFVTLTDRAKDVIKSGGEWISSVELENCLIAHPDVLEAAVVGVPDERWQERPLAVVVLNEGASASAGDLRMFLADKVVRWWLPERWAFADEVPRTSVGKYDKKTIRSRYAEHGYWVIEVRD